jgi:hypothetical protein
MFFDGPAESLLGRMSGFDEVMIEAHTSVRTNSLVCVLCEATKRLEGCARRKYNDVFIPVVTKSSPL